MSYSTTYKDDIYVEKNTITGTNGNLKLDGTLYTDTISQATTNGVLLNNFKLTGSLGGVPTIGSANAVNVLAVGTNGQILTADSTNPTNGVSWKNLMPEVAVIYETHTTGTAPSDTIVSGSWVTRTLTTLTSSNSTHITLASNTITLATGTYLIDGSCPAGSIIAAGKSYPIFHKARLQNTTAVTTALVGTAEYANGTYTRSLIRGIVTTTANTNFQLQHFVTLQGGTGTASFGEATSAASTNEVYSTVTITKIA